VFFAETDAGNELLLADIKSGLRNVESIVDDNIRKIVTDPIKQSGGYGIGTDKNGKDALCRTKHASEADKSGVIKTTAFFNYQKSVIRHQLMPRQKRKILNQ
jgi:hypothetical protein